MHSFKTGILFIIYNKDKKVKIELFLSDLCSETLRWKVTNQKKRGLKSSQAIYKCVRNTRENHDLRTIIQSDIVHKNLELFIDTLDQWYRGRTFSRIYRVVSMTEIRNMYEVYHEMDLAHFVERLDELWNQYYPETNLKRIRDLVGLSQRDMGNTCISLLK